MWMCDAVRPGRPAESRIVRVLSEVAGVDTVVVEDDARIMNGYDVVVLGVNEELRQPSGVHFGIGQPHFHSKMAPARATNTVKDNYYCPQSPNLSDSMFEDGLTSMEEQEDTDPKHSSRRTDADQPGEENIPQNIVRAPTPSSHNHQQRHRTKKTAVLSSKRRMGPRDLHLLYLILAVLNFLLLVHGSSAFLLDGSQSSFAQFRKWYTGLNGTLELEFKSEQPNGLVLYTDDGGTYDFFELKLVEGVLRLRYNLGGGAQIITVGRDLHDGHWHKVQVNKATTLSRFNGFNVVGCTGWRLGWKWGKGR